MSAADALQFAVYNRLVEFLNIPIYDHAPQQVDGEYIIIGMDTLTDWSTDCDDGFEVVMTVHTWTVPTVSQKYSGAMRCKQIQGLIYDALNREEFTITGYGNLGVVFEFQETFLDPDGESYHGVQRFRLLIETITS